MSTSSDEYQNKRRKLLDELKELEKAEEEKQRKKAEEQRKKAEEEERVRERQDKEKIQEAMGMTMLVFPIKYKAALQDKRDLFEVEAKKYKIDFYNQYILGSARIHVDVKKVKNLFQFRMKITPYGYKDNTDFEEYVYSPKNAVEVQSWNPKFSISLHNELPSDLLQTAITLFTDEHAETRRQQMDAWKSLARHFDLCRNSRAQREASKSPHLVTNQLLHFKNVTIHQLVDKFNPDSGIAKELLEITEETPIVNERAERLEKRVEEAFGHFFLKDPPQYVTCFQDEKVYDQWGVRVDKFADRV